MYTVLQFWDVTVIRLSGLIGSVEVDGVEQLKKDDLWLGKYRAGDLEEGIYDHAGKRLPDDGA